MSRWHLGWGAWFWPVVMCGGARSRQRTFRSEKDPAGGGPGVQGWALGNILQLLHPQYFPFVPQIFCIMELTLESGVVGAQGHWKPWGCGEAGQIQRDTSLHSPSQGFAGWSSIQYTSLFICREFYNVELCASASTSVRTKLNICL